MKALANKDERVEIRLSAEDKEIFKRAQELSGDKSFSSFVIRVVKKQAQSIISESERILASKRDREIFFDAVFGSTEPNENLIAAAKKYNSTIVKK